MKAKRIFYRLLFFLLLAVSADSLVIKLGSLAPEGSPWDKALRRIAADWNLLSHGELKVKVYAGGIAGDEPNMVRKLRINQLQAAAMTGVGLGGIAEGIYAVQLPLLIRSSEELEYVMDKMEPTLNGMLEEKGFTMLAWYLAGWAHFFSKTPVIRPDDMKRLKMHVENSVPAISQAWKQMGFHVVAIPPTEVLPALQSGLVEAFLLTPLTAAALQWFGAAKNMTALEIAPMLGGIIISQRIWDRIPADLQPELLAAVSRQLDTLRRETESLEEKALAIMLENGLKVHPVPAPAEAEWERLVQEGLELVLGSAIPAEPVEEVRRHLRDYRQR